MYLIKKNAREASIEKNKKIIFFLLFLKMVVINDNNNKPNMYFCLFNIIYIYYTFVMFGALLNILLSDPYHIPFIYYVMWRPFTTACVHVCPMCCIVRIQRCLHCKTSVWCWRSWRKWALCWRKPLQNIHLCPSVSLNYFNTIHHLLSWDLRNAR